MTWLVLYKSIVIGAGIYVVDVGQPNILVTLSVTWRKLMQYTANIFIVIFTLFNPSVLFPFK